EERSECSWEEDGNLLSGNRSLSPPLHHRSRRRVAGQSVRRRLTRRGLPARAGQSSYGWAARLPLPAHIPWAVLWIRLPSGGNRPMGARRGRGSLAVEAILTAARIPRQCEKGDRL